MRAIQSFLLFFCLGSLSWTFACGVHRTEESPQHNNTESIFTDQDGAESTENTAYLESFQEDIQDISPDTSTALICPVGQEAWNGQCVQSCGTLSCRCNNDSDCPASMVCKATEGNCKQCVSRRCEGTSCPPCPTGWEWVTDGSQQRCRKACPNGVTRRTDGVCDVASPPTLSSPSVPSLDNIGPNKPCPGANDPNPKWDMDYAAQLQKQGITPSVVLYVDQSASSSGDGSQTKPYQTMQTAINSAPKDALILVAPGVYKEFLLINKPLRLIGRCTAGTQLKVPSFTVAGIRAEPDLYNGTLAIEGLTIHGEGLAYFGIRSDKFREIFLRHLDISHIPVRSIALEPGGTLNVIEYCRIHPKGNPLQTMDSKGISITGGPTSGKVIIRYNHILESGTSGIRVTIADDITITNNLVEHNGFGATRGQGLSPDGHGILIYSQIIKVNISYNIIRYNTRNGLYLSGLISSGGSINIVGNHISHSGYLLINNQDQLIGKDSYGILIEDAEVPVLIKDNHIVQNSSHGIYLDPQRVHDKTVTIENNLIAQNGCGHGGGYGVWLTRLSGQIAVRGNLIQGNASSGLKVDQSPELEKLTIAENQIENSGKSRCDGDPLAHGIFLQKISGVLLVEKNALRVHRKHGLLLQSSQQLKGSIMRNLLINLPEYASSIGMRLEDLQGEGLDIQNNLVTGFSVGGSFHQLKLPTRLTSNVWHSNNSGGVSFTLLGQEAQIKGDFFSDNGRQHVQLLNNQALITIEQSGFAYGKENAVLSGANGLIRPIFVRNESPDAGPRCALPSLQDWSYRHYRVPHHIDPCERWIHPNDPPALQQTLRNEKARIEASACNKCFRQGLGCRWIWEYVKGSGEGGYWQPKHGTDGPYQNITLQCVSVTEQDSCRQPPPQQGTQGIILTQGEILRDQCVALSTPSHEPCQSFHSAKRCISRGRSETLFCQGGESCDTTTGECVFSPTCKTDQHCQQLYTCHPATHRCTATQPSSCQTDSDCRFRHEQCLQGQCVFAGSCQANSDCPQRKCELQTGACSISIACFSDIDCLKNAVCDQKSNRCIDIKTCKIDGDCQGSFGKYSYDGCDTTSGRCRYRIRCQYSEDCLLWGETCNTATGLCECRSCTQKCQQHSDCGADHRCDTTTGLCRAVPTCDKDTDCPAPESCRSVNGRNRCVCDNTPGTSRRAYCGWVLEQTDDSNKTERLSVRCVPWDTPSACREPDSARNYCSQTQACLFEQRIVRPQDPIPSSLILRHNVFVENRGPDLLLDMAGVSVIEHNVFHFCVQNSSANNGTCEAKQLRVSTSHVPLATPSQTVVWLHQNPYVLFPSDLRIRHNVLEQRTKQSVHIQCADSHSLVATPQVCQGL